MMVAVSARVALLVLSGAGLVACRWDLDHVQLEDGGGVLGGDAVVSGGDAFLPIGVDAPPGTDGGGVDGPITLVFDELLVEDTHIASNGGGPFGSEISLRVGGNPEKRLLIRFDLESIPTGAIVERADLAIFFTDDFPPPTVGIHRLMVPWDELLATWSVRAWSTPWTGDGAEGDFDQNPSAALTVVGGSGVSAATDVTALVQDWVSNPSTNFGVILLSQDEGNVAASEDTDVMPVEPGPTLTVTYR